MEKPRSENKKVIHDGGVMTIELFGPTKNPPKPKRAIFNKPAPTEWKPKWPRNIDFLFVCTGFCAGLGNLWRFPSIALEYGGGSFLIVYLIVLLFIGIPAFYLEVVLGQFASRAGARLFDCVPIFRGVGYGQVFLSIVIASYYAGISAQAGKYLVESFRQALPLNECRSEMYKNCLFVSENSNKLESHDNLTLVESYSRHNGILEVNEFSSISCFTPNLELMLYLLICWIFVALIVRRVFDTMVLFIIFRSIVEGMRTLSLLSGFLIFAIFSISIVFNAQAVFLPGAVQGIIKFFTPEWKYFLKIEMWYAAIVQVFFSLGLCFGPVTMYSSFNRFSYNMFLDSLLTIFVNILIILATGCTYFAVIGNLAEASGLRFEDYADRLNHDTLSAYYQTAAKFDYVPEVSSAIIFLLFSLLGIASVSALTFFIVHMIRDEFLIRKTLKIIIFITIIMFLVSCIYLAPFGKYLLVLLDTNAIPFAIGLNSVMEFIALAWVYGVKRVSDDIEFMFGFKTRSIWRIMWCLLPMKITIPFVFYLVHFGNKFDFFKLTGVSLSTVGYVFGWTFISVILFTISIWGIFVVLKQPMSNFLERVRLGAIPDCNWGPADKSLLLNYRYFILKKDNVTT